MPICPVISASQYSVKEVSVLPKISFTLSLPKPNGSIYHQMHGSQIVHFPRVQTITNQPILGKYLLFFRLPQPAAASGFSEPQTSVEYVCIGCRELWPDQVPGAT